MEELNKHFEAIISEFLRTRKLGSTQDSPLKDRLGKYPSGWAWEINPEGYFVWCSSELQNLMGYRPEVLSGEHFTSILSSEKSKHDLHQAISSQQPIFNLKLASKTQDGRPATLLLNAIPRKSAVSGVSGYRGVAQLLGEERFPGQETIKVPVTSVERGVASPAPLATNWEPPLGYSLRDGQLHLIGAPEPAQNISDIQISNASMRVPILGQQDVLLGIMEFERSSDQPKWSEEDKELANTISRQLAHAIQDVRSSQLTQQALDEMRKADQLKTEFLANMSHELRTPLNSIIGFSRVILKGLDGPITDVQRQDLTSIYNAGQHLLGLINNILDFSKIETGNMDLEFTEVDLTEIINSVMETASGLVRGRPIELLSQVGESLPKIWGNSIRIRQVLLNLLSNAIKFTDEGMIGVATQVVREPDEQVIVSVFDSGPGIAQQDMEKLFEPFSQLEASPSRIYGGTGLGLSICRHLVELHGGHIWVDSTLGKGSTFHFTLLTVPEEPDLEGPPILAVYAQQAQFDLLEDNIAAAGYQLLPIFDVQKTPSIAEEFQPQVILIDPRLPAGLGWHQILEIRNNPALQRIPIKTFSILDDLQHGFDLGISDIIVKHQLKESLKSAVSRLLSEPSENDVIVVVDEDENMLEQTRTILQDNFPGEVRTAASGFEGVVVTRQQVPDLVILDLFLANAGGFRLVESLRIDARTRNTPVILLFPPELSEIRIRQLQLWTNHCYERATFPVQEFFAKLIDQLAKIQASSTE